MNTKNLKVKCLTTFDSGKFTEGNLYSVLSSSDFGGHGHRIQIIMETNNPGEKHQCWMPATMRSGDLSCSECFELVVEEDVTAKADDIGDAIQYSIQCGMMAGGPIFAAMKRSDYLGKGFLSRCMMADLDTLICKPNPDEVYVAFEVESQPESGLIKHRNDDRTHYSYYDEDGNLRFRLCKPKNTKNKIPLSERGDQVSSYEALMELRNVLRCPDGANIIIWAEILAAGYFGEKHRKGGAIEDAIHYKKNGAYSDETLAKILAAIVNDSTNC